MRIPVQARLTSRETFPVRDDLGRGLAHHFINLMLRAGAQA